MKAVLLETNSFGSKMNIVRLFYKQNKHFFGFGTNIEKMQKKS